MDSQGIKIKLQSVIVAEQDVLRLQSQIEHLQCLEGGCEEQQDYADLKAELLAKIEKHKQLYRVAQKIIDSLLIVKRGQRDSEKTRACKTILAERYLNGKDGRRLPGLSTTQSARRNAFTAQLWKQLPRQLNVRKKYNQTNERFAALFLFINQ